MSIEEILAQFKYLRGPTIPREAIEEAIARREEITPALLQVIATAKEAYENPEIDDDYMAPIYAMYLLAQFREQRAYPLIVNLFSSFHGPISFDVIAELAVGGLERILSSVSQGDTSLIRQLIENSKVNEFVRSAGIYALLVLVANNAITRDEVIAYFHSLFNGGLEREYSFVWTALVDGSNQLYSAELLDEIKQAFENNLIDEFVMNFSEVEADLALGQEAVMAKLKQYPLKRYIEDAAEEMESWAFPEVPELPKIPLQMPQRLAYEPPPPIKPASVGPKPGRNEPCPCGSGRKYKRCCGK